MPLRDHFHPPLSDRFQWSELFCGWPSEMVRHLRAVLPTGLRAAPNLFAGSLCEIDAIINREGLAPHRDTTDENTTFTAPSPTLTLDAQFNEEDEFEVKIYEDSEYERTLVAAIEIVSPANKDRPNSRSAFVTKCSSLLSRGVCVSIVDLVTSKHFNHYTELLARIGRSDPSFSPVPPSISAVTLRTNYSGKRPKVETWAYPLTVGSPLPTLPIWLGDDKMVSLELETSYTEACRVLQIP
jgi:hypothetical protein